ncbi:hypothetical protein ACFV2N_36840 [Streptomyces sp. NPDC059680]|uniref:hypothetical protein n=1 Tax=Streptomyces sp. NPDC059680 TaxID=3346904 RepID=UPI00368BC565
MKVDTAAEPATLFKRPIAACQAELLLTGPGGLPLAHVSGVTTRVADRLQRGLHVVAAEAEEHRAGRAVLE